MNFITRDIGSADSEMNQSVNLNMLHVREQDAGHKGTRSCAWAGANGNEQFSTAQLHNLQLHNLPIQLTYIHYDSYLYFRRLSLTYQQCLVSFLAQKTQNAAYFEASTN